MICKNALKKAIFGLQNTSIDLFISYRFYFFSIQNLMIDNTDIVNENLGIDYREPTKKNI